MKSVSPVEMKVSRNCIKTACEIVLKGNKKNMLEFEMQSPSSHGFDARSQVQRRLAGEITTSARSHTT